MQTLSQDKVSYWLGHMKRQIQSGQSIAQYCLRAFSFSVAVYNLVRINNLCAE
jgi:hypothetical protein